MSLFKLSILLRFTLLRKKPRVFRPWMNTRRVPFEAPKERSRVCFGGFRPTKHVEEPRALARGAPRPYPEALKRVPLYSFFNMR